METFCFGLLQRPKGGYSKGQLVWITIIDGSLAVWLAFAVYWLVRPSESPFRFTVTQAQYTWLWEHGVYIHAGLAIILGVLIAYGIVSVGYGLIDWQRHRR